MGSSLALKGMFPKISSSSSSGGSLCCKSLKAQAIRRRMIKRNRVRPARIMMKRRRVVSSGSRTPATNEVERKVRTLKKLIPNESTTPLVGLDGLFRQAADYIQSLQMKVMVMQVMVKELTGSEEV